MTDILRWARTQWDRAAAVLAAVAGASALVLGWLGASGAVYPAAQIPFVVSGGLGGLFLVGIAGALWLSADLRDEWRELHRIESHLAAHRTEPASGPSTNGDRVRESATSQARSAGSAMTSTAP